MLPSLTIIDDFLVDPWAARREALGLGYDPALQKGNFPGLNSTSPLPTEAIDSSVSRLLGVKLKGAAGTNHGHCRITSKTHKGRSGVHIDPAAYSPVLTGVMVPAGTDFFRHKRTGLERVPSEPARIAASGYGDVNALVEDVVNKDTTYPAKWERVMRIPIRFNRLVLFSPWQFHTAAPGFGTDLEDSRLVVLLFFDRA